MQRRVERLQNNMEAQPLSGSPRPELIPDDLDVLNVSLIMLAAIAAA